MVALWLQKIVKSKRIFDKVSQGSLPFFDDRKGERKGGSYEYT
jgi:hypothetical protein